MARKGKPLDKQMKRLAKKYKKIPEPVVQGVSAVMAEEGNQAVALMKQLVPKNKNILASSIRWRWERRDGSMVKMRIMAGNSLTKVSNKSGHEFDNAFLQEFGTINMSANPFFRPVWNANRRRIKRRIDGKVRSIIKKIQKKKRV